MILLLLFLMGGLSTAAPVDPKMQDKAWGILRDGTADKILNKRTRAVHALSLLPKNSKAETLAEKALKDDAREVRVEAATALGKIGGATARPALKEALKDKEVAVILASANALYELHDPAAYEVYYAVLTGKQKSGPGLLQAQAQMLHDRKQLEKIAFETGIGFVPFGSIGYEAWKTITHDESSAIRVMAAERLASDRDEKTSDALIEFCADKKWQVRAAVAIAIANRGDPSLAPALVPLLDDTNDAVRYQAAAALIRLSSTAPVKRRPRPQKTASH